ncbi:hypothetical protein, partial [Hymenobacter rigui]|uniref:hypothetical protein n=1 Tax=Hymenobacter rigui TaxID=334424 RepID=UPI00196AA75D
LARPRLAAGGRHAAAQIKRIRFHIPFYAAARSQDELFTNLLYYIVWTASKKTGMLSLSKHLYRFGYPTSVDRDASASSACRSEGANTVCFC